MHAAQREMFVALHSEHPCTEHVCTYTHFSSINFKPALKAAQAFVLPGTQATQSDAVHVRDVLELESAAQTTLRQRNTAKQEREKKNAFLLTLKTRDKKHRTITKKKKEMLKQQKVREALQLEHHYKSQGVVLKQKLIGASAGRLKLIKGQKENSVNKHKKAEFKIQKGSTTL